MAGIHEILAQDNFYVDETHPRKSCTLYNEHIVCHPDDLDLVREGLRAFFTAQDVQKCTGKKFWFQPAGTKSRRTKK